MLKLIEMKFKDGQLEGHCPHCNNFHMIDIRELIQTPFKVHRVNCDGCGTTLEPFVKDTGKLFIALTRNLWLYTEDFSDKDVETFLLIANIFTAKNSTRRIKNMVNDLNRGDMRV